MMKKNWPLFVLIATIGCFAASSLFATVSGKIDQENKGPFNAYFKTYTEANPQLKKFSAKKSIPVGQMTRLDVKTLVSDIRIEVGSSNEIAIALDGHFQNEDQDTILNVHANGDELVIDVNEHGPKKDGNFNFVFGGDSDGRLTLTIPAQMQDLKIASASGEVRIKGPSFGNIHTQTASGDVKIESDKIASLKNESASGDLKLKGQIGNLDADSASGDFVLQLKNADPKLKIDSASGDIRVAFAAEPDVEISFDSMSGDLSVDKDWHSNKSGKSGHLTIKNGRGTVDVDTMSGDLKIEKLTE